MLEDPDGPGWGGGSAPVKRVLLRRDYPTGSNPLPNPFPGVATVRPCGGSAGGIPTPEGEWNMSPRRAAGETRLAGCLIIILPLVALGLALTIRVGSRL